MMITYNVTSPGYPEARRGSSRGGPSRPARPLAPDPGPGHQRCILLIILITIITTTTTTNNNDTTTTTTTTTNIKQTTNDKEDKHKLVD